MRLGKTIPIKFGCFTLDFHYICKNNMGIKNIAV